MQFLQRIFSTKVLPSWTILFLDMIIAVFSVVVAFILRSGIPAAFSNPSLIWSSVILVLAVDLVFFRIFRTYRNVIRLSSFVDLMNIFAAQACSFIVSLAICLVFLYVVKYPIIPSSVLIISYVVCFVMMVTFRMGVKTVYDEFSSHKKTAMPVFVYGTREGGVNVAKSLRLSGFDRFNLKGFITDDPDMVGKTTMGCPVYANTPDVVDILSEKRIKGIIIPPNKIPLIRESDFADRMLKAGIQLFSAPALIEGLDDGKKTMEQIKPVKIEDLLMREPIEIDMKRIASQLEGKRILITGAAGSIGSEIVRQVAGFNPYMLILIDQAETPLHDLRMELRQNWRDLDSFTIVANIANEARMESIFSEYRPDIVFHAAAYKHVPMMEDNVSEAVQNNILGTRILADLSVKYKVEKFVMISTDKAVNPSNVMGCSKRICEIYVQSLARKIAAEGGGTHFITTRFGNVLGSNGSVIPLFRRQIENGGPVTVTHPDIIRYFMTIPEACRLVLEAGCMGSGGEIYIFDMGKPVKIVDLANKMILLSGRNDIKIEFTGLRHGEKLYEELLASKENVDPTSHDKIMIAKVREVDYAEASASIDDLIKSSYSFDPRTIVSKMKEIVPEFRSLNSEFSVLDRKD